MMFYLCALMPLIGISFIGIYALIQSKINNEKEYQDKLRSVKERQFHSFCSPEILRAMLENLNYKIYCCAPDPYHHPDIVFLYCEQKFPSPAIALYANTRKEMEELVKIYKKHEKMCENIRSEKLQKCHDHSYEFLTQVQKDLNVVIEQEYARQAAEMNKIKEIAERINEEI